MHCERCKRYTTSKASREQKDTDMCICIVFTHINGQFLNKLDNLTMVEVAAITSKARENVKVDDPKYVVYSNS